MGSIRKCLKIWLPPEDHWGSALSLLMTFQKIWFVYVKIMWYFLISTFVHWNLLSFCDFSKCSWFFYSPSGNVIWAFLVPPLRIAACRSAVVSCMMDRQISPEQPEGQLSSHNNGNLWPETEHQLHFELAAVTSRNLIQKKQIIEQNNLLSNRQIN